MKKNLFSIVSIPALFLLLFSCGTDFSTDVHTARPEVTVSSGSDAKNGSSEGEEKGESEDSAGKNEGAEYVYEDEDDEDDAIYEVIDDVAEIPDYHREWTVLVYMAADNNLESDAICDFNEMENAAICDEVTVLVLFDRSEGYDASNGDWSGTRLYKISRDEQQNKTLIVSERLPCEDLGLSVDYDTELDMSKSATLIGFEGYARKNYPADNYALFIWGHGTGWRSQVSPSEDATSTVGTAGISRAVAIEEDTGSYMSISSLRSAIDEGMDGDEFAIIGFDTCFGMCLETAYELRDCAKYMLGTPSLVPESGWNYTALFDSFCSSQRSVENLIDSICEQYKKSYESYSYASFACVNLSLIGNAVARFDSAAKSLADFVTTKEKRDEIFQVLTKNTVSYCASEYPTDFYVDVLDMCRTLPSFGALYDLKNAINDTLVCSWSAASNNCSFGVFFCVYKSASVISGTHPSNYINGSRDTLLSRFVSECTGYVPTSLGGESLLDKLFYTTF